MVKITWLPRKIYRTNHVQCVDSDREGYFKLTYYEKTAIAECKTYSIIVTLHPLFNNVLLK